MAVAKHISKFVSHVILDLDGTLLNTDGIVVEVLKSYLIKNGKRWDPKKSALKIVGTTPMEAAAAIVEDYELPCSKEELMTEITPMFNDLWCNVKPLPGATRLLEHLCGHGVPFALASNSHRANIEAKIAVHHGWKDYFWTIVGGDEVPAGKPSPDVFLEAARRMEVDPSKCLVIEDSPPGVMAGKAAGMKVIAVPSLRKHPSLYDSADKVICSLLDLKLENWGLPSFEDWIEDTLPITPSYIGGPVIKGFGRGSKILGIPTGYGCYKRSLTWPFREPHLVGKPPCTPCASLARIDLRFANISPEGFSDILATQASGVYFGWARLSTRGIYKMVMSIGWNPYFDNLEKTIEPWLLHDFDEDFYGEELRLVIVGYIRPEASFPSLESLVSRIHEDRKVAERALELPVYSTYKDAPFLTSSH